MESNIAKLPNLTDKLTIKLIAKTNKATFAKSPFVWH